MIYVAMFDVGKRLKLEEHIHDTSWPENRVVLRTCVAARCGERIGRTPNILLITADDMSWDSVGVYGCPVEEITPNIDRLASEGIQFDYGYVQIAICTPSRQVMLSGSHSHQTMTRCFTELERVGPALPDVLKQNGYHIANINKQQDFYDWDTAIKETESGFGRDIPFHSETVSGIIEPRGRSRGSSWPTSTIPTAPSMDRTARRMDQV